VKDPAKQAHEATWKAFHHYESLAKDGVDYAGPIRDGLLIATQMLAEYEHTCAALARLCPGLQNKYRRD
jgi:hypothetical protein